MTTTALDDTDRGLIALLRRDARTPTAELARRLGLSRTTVQARLERLERTKAIVGYTVLTGESFDPGAIRATVLIQVEPRETGAVVSALRKMREVQALFTTAGRFDMAMELAAPGTAQLDAALDVIGALSGVRGMESLIHLTVKVDRRA